MLKNKGFTLVEILVSMLIASIALLGLAATQLRSLQFATNSFDYTVSLILSQNAMERIWSQLCTIQHANPSYYNDAGFQSALLAPQDLRSSFTVDVAENYPANNSMAISVTWFDARVNTYLDSNPDAQMSTEAGNNTDKVTINATFVDLPSTCTPTAIL